MLHLAEEAELFQSKCNLEQEEKVLRNLRTILLKTLQIIDKKLEIDSSTLPNTNDYCPYCQSSNIKKHGTQPVKRKYCSDCKKAFATERQPFYYRRRNRNKILDFIVAIYTSDKSAVTIIKELKISSRTYYQWGREVLSVFPQLEDKIINRHKK